MRGGRPAGHEPPGSAGDPDASPAPEIQRLIQRLILPLLLLAGASPAAGQEAEGPRTLGGARVETVGASDVSLDRRLGHLLDGDPLILARDTLIAAGDTVAGSLLLLDATLILEGTILGDLVLVDAGAFVRPDSRVDGDLVNMGGGLYRSELARVGGAIIDAPLASYRVVREGEDRIVIEASDAPSALTLDGVMGFHPPTYDRVNGLTLLWGARYRLPRLGELMPSVHGQAGWLTERGDPTYGGSLDLRVHATTLSLAYDRGWVTNDDWIREDLSNSLNYFWDGDDLRDYHQAERVWAELGQAFGDEDKHFFARAFVRGQVEDATSLEAGFPWHLPFGDEEQPNPAIDPGRVSSAIAGLRLEWRGRTVEFEGGLEYEAARDWLEGDFAFDRGSAWGEWAMQGLARHTLEIEFFLQRPLSGDAMPRQRWSFVGGTGTLQTVDFHEYSGDHVVFVESKYIIPFPDRLRLPLLGAPDLELVHAGGMAWLDGEDPAYEQEIGAELVFFGLSVRYMLDPVDTGNSDLDIGLSWPFGDSYPWER